MNDQRILEEDSMSRLLSNRFVDALAKTIVFFGSVHLIILAIAAIRGDLFALNAFNILSLDLFLPGLGEGMVNFVLSYCVVLGVYLVAYRYLARPARHNNQDSRFSGS
jgi:hypothetical protein